MNTVAVNAAAGAAPGAATLHVNSLNLGDHRIESNGGVQNAGDQQVKMMRLDDIIADSHVERVDVIKIDVQGFEWHVTRGMEHTMTKFKPRAVICEYWPHGIEAAGGNPAEMFADFQRWGYRCRALESDRPLATYEDLVGQLPALDQASPDSCYLNVVLER